MKTVWNIIKAKLIYYIGNVIIFFGYYKPCPMKEYNTNNLRYIMI